MADFVSAAAAAYHFDPGKVIAVGYSNGANIAGRRATPAADVSGGGGVAAAVGPVRRRAGPDLTGKPILIAAGRADPIVPADQAPRLADLLRSAGAEVTLVTEAQGHALEPSDLGLSREWLGTIRKS